MATFSNLEKKLLKYVPDTPSDRLHSSLVKIREVMEDIWAIDAPRIIQDYTDHGKDHCERLAGFADNLLKANRGDRLSAQEMYLLLAGIYLHDIGMQCDVIKFSAIKKKAEDLGAQFNVDFTAPISSDYGIDEQKAIRENHHYLSAAWIDYAYSTGKTVLGIAAKTIHSDLVDDLIDVCKYHSKLPITDCPSPFKFNQTGRKQLVAAILRFSDELDIDSNRVSIETVKNFRLDPRNEIYWWLCNQTSVLNLTHYVIELTIKMCPNDKKRYGSLVKSIFIDGFCNKNAPVLDILAHNGIVIRVSSGSKVVEHERTKRFPPEIAKALEAMQKSAEIEKEIISIKGSRIPVKDFFGRKEDIKRSINLLKERSFAIIGMKGIGKSKLLSALFEKVIKDKSFQFKRYYWSCFRYGAPPSFSEFGRQLIKDLTNEDIIDFGRSEVGEQVQLVIRTLEEKQCLLVIDQFEAIIDRETRRLKDKGFDEFLACAKEGLETARLIVTAWEVPKDSKEREFPHVLLKGVDESAGIEIIRNEIPEEDRSTLEGLEEDIKKLIKDKLQGHPGALQWIAPLLSAGIQEIINDHTLWRGRLEKIVTNIVSKGYTRISQDTNLKKVLSSVCIFSKPCDINAVIFVTDMSRIEAFQALNELIKRSLVSRLQNETYSVHALVREYVLNQLTDKEKNHFHRKAADFYLNEPCPPPENRKSIDEVYPLLEAIDHLISADRAKEAGELFMKEELHDELYCWSYFKELVEIYKHFEEEKENIPKNMLSIFLGNLGLSYRDLGDLQEAKRYYEKALVIAQDCQDKNSECTQLVNLGDVYHYLGEIDRSIEYHNKAKGFFKKIENKKLEARNFGGLGNSLSAKEDLQKAKEYYEQAIAICREVGDKRYEGIWLGDLGNIYAEMGELRWEIS